MTDDAIEDLIREAQAMGPMAALEFQAETEAIRAYARQAWLAGIKSRGDGRLDMEAIKRQGRLARAGNGQNEDYENTLGDGLGDQTQ